MTLRVVLEHDRETGDYSAVCPDLPGCASAGETEEEARAAIREAIALYLAPAELDPRENAKLVELGKRGTARLNANQVIEILRRHGFSRVGSSGTRPKWRHPFSGKQVIVDYHRGRILPLGTLRAIIEGSGIATEEWSG
jgi:predicted RNase H-like HicB family nuclease/predicted RNA binding protein YcfA (HicA-like mRNA interferase family)